MGAGRCWGMVFIYMYMYGIYDIYIYTLRMPMVEEMCNRDIDSDIDRVVCCYCNCVLLFWLWFW
jgi:hypothetical protein